MIWLLKDFWNELYYKGCQSTELLNEGYIFQIAPIIVGGGKHVNFNAVFKELLFNDFNDHLQ